MSHNIFIVSIMFFLTMFQENKSNRFSQEKTLKDTSFLGAANTYHINLNKKYSKFISLSKEFQSLMDVLWVEVMIP